MFLSKNLAILAVAGLAGNALALNAHRHGGQHLHAKKDYIETEIEIVTDYVTVTEWIGGAPTSVVFVDTEHSTVNTTTPTPTPTPTPQSVYTPSTTPTPSPTTLSTSATPSPSSTSVLAAAIEDAVQVVTSSSSSATPYVAPTSSSAAASASSSAASSSTSTSTGNRGLAFNDADLLSGFLSSGTKCNWAYNWGQTSTMTADVPYVPMLWGATSDYTSTWTSNAEAAIASGSTALLSFNEPDNSAQSNLLPAAAAQAHIEYMNPFQGKASIGSPAITNSATAGEGIDWLTEFLSECNGECVIDFIACHWYNSADSDDFLSHLTAVHEAAPDYPIWVTEFAPLGASDDEISEFLTTVMDAMDSDSTYDFVDRYAYFMVEADSLVSSGTSLSSYGQVYAYDS